MQPSAKPSKELPAPRRSVFAGHPAGRSVRRRRSARRSSWLLLGLVLTILCSVSAGAYAVDRSFNSVQAAVESDLRSGQAELEAGKAALKEAAKTGTIASIDAAEVHIANARRSFARARVDLAKVPFLNQARTVPYLGPRLNAVLGLSDMGLALCDAATEAAAIDRTMATKPSNTTGGASLLALLKQIESPLVKVRSDLQRASAAGVLIDLAVLPAAQRPALTQARASIANGLASVDEFDNLIPVLYEVLGANGPRNYLLEQLNPAELRPGGGFMGTYSLLRVDAGSVSIIKTGSTDQLTNPRPQVGQKGYVVPPGPIHDFLGVASWTLQDSNFFASFPENAKAALDFSKASFNVPVDAVIGMDFYTTIDLLTLSGPISVPGSGRTVDAGNFLQTLIDLGDFGIAGGPAKQLVSALGGPLMQRMISLPAQGFPQLLTVLNKAATTRHLQTYFANQKAEDAMTRFGWSGVLNPTGATDFIAEVEGNYGGTKANFYLTRTFQVALTLTGSTLHHHVVVTLVNATPAKYPNNYTCYARIFIPTQSANLKDGGLRPPRFADTTSSAGSAQMGGWVDVRPGQGGVQISFDYDTPGQPDANGQHVIYMQKQPGTVSDALSVSWKNGSVSASATSTLTQDVVIRLSASQVEIQAGQAGTAHLPSLSL